MPSPTNSTTRSFSTMLNEYLTNDLMKTELLERSWLMSNIKIDTSHPGGTVPVPFESGAATSVKFGGLTGSTDVAEYAYVRGTLASPVEMWGTMLFRHRDLLDGHGKVKEKSFLERS